jgi:pimeloyl-ACP methyl ester carboxylesterase
MEYKERYFTAGDGLQLYFREYGEGGQAVICIPGLTRNCKDFHKIALHLAPRYRVICMDLRGRGRSDRDPNWRNYNLAVSLPDVRQLMDEAGIGQAIFLGTSLGGLISMTMAYQAPERVRAMILNDAGPEWDPAGIARVLLNVGNPAPVRNWEEAARQARDTYGLALRGMPDEFWTAFARQSYAEGPDGIPVLDRDPKISDAIRAAVKAMKLLKWLRALRLRREIRGVPLDAWDSFRAVTMPCLVLRGEISDILTEGIVDRMQAVKPDLQCATIPNRGHAPLLDEPESLKAIDAFLADLY